MQSTYDNLVTETDLLHNAEKGFWFWRPHELLQHCLPHNSKTVGQ